MAKQDFASGFLRTLIFCGPIILLSSCISAPDLVRTPTEFQVQQCEEGMRLMGPGWLRIAAPIEAEKLLFDVRFDVPPQGLVWYGKDDSTFGACAFTNDKYGCGYSGHIFKRVDGLWFHATAWSQVRICVVG
ncbi:MAG: hypothetical protein R3F04_05290 [Lysobacteraceae bacterium]